MRTNTNTKTWDVLRHTAHRILPVVGLLSLGAAAVLPVGETHAFETWGPERPTYTWQKPADHATLNSITDDPVMGDERNFVRIRKAGTNDKFDDNVMAEPGAEYEVQVFFHNNAAANLNDATGRTFAKPIRVRMNEISASITKGQSAMIKGLITADNATPKEVWDTAYIQTNQTVSLRYVRGSARIHNGGKLNGSLIDDDALFGKYGGTFVGYDQWGYLPGCNEYSGNITFRIKVDKAGFDMNKSVSKDLANNYQNSIDAVPGETLDFKIHFRNTGTTVLRNVSVYDLLGKGMSFVPGTTRIFNAGHPNGTFEKDNLFKNGFNIGDYKGGTDATITYKVKIDDDEKMFPCGQTVTIENNSAAAIDVATIHDKVQVRVTRKCGDTPKNPTPKTPETPKELPRTGASEVVLGMVITAVLGIGIAYYLASMKQLNKLESAAKGKK
ncbi:DUF11 domain-containing protein [Candidatus Nanosyncoccus nanoralicus]|uniref:DUF11 domain-containing protein n=1 Tax=Candidatus Nanosyncoccus nanoralicus TaxID=2171996 RepID=A0ABY0FK49_9BACT|nr:DUF11 domain-containing protein [Candidatus Nanosyncoccus nanoralicus]RYC73656.1 hypothetical protein G3KMM_00295 [Candidatus Nanosyncoccus nanoralicus]